MVRVLITCGGTTLDKSQHTGLEKRTRKSRRSSGANRGGNLDGTVRVTKTGNFKSNKISVNVNAYPDPNQPHLDKFLDNPAAFKDIILGINETDGREWQAPYDPAENKCHYMSRSTDNYRAHYYPTRGYLMVQGRDEETAIRIMNLLIGKVKSYFGIITLITLITLITRTGFRVAHNGQRLFWRPFIVSSCQQARAGNSVCKGTAERGAGLSRAPWRGRTCTRHTWARLPRFGPCLVTAWYA